MKQKRILNGDIPARTNEFPPWPFFSADEVDAVVRVLRSGHVNYWTAEEWRCFQSQFADWVGVSHAVAMANGTVALEAALYALGIGPGDEVVVTPRTFIASASCVVLRGAKPVFADIDEKTFNISPLSIKNKISKKTKAILPVHLYGNPADMDEIMKTASEHKLLIIEDCAQSLGAKYNNKMTGTIGNAGTISFFPTKNLGCAGDGGAIITNDDELAKTAKMLRVHGAEKKYVHSFLGFNSRLDSLQAALLSIKLPDLDKKNARRKEIAEIYAREIKTEKIKKPEQNSDNSHIYHQYTILSSQRDELKDYLLEKGVESTIYYPVPLHKQKAFEKYSDGLILPNAEKAADMVLSLPIYPELKDEEAEYIC